MSHLYNNCQIYIELQKAKEVLKIMMHKGMKLIIIIIIIHFKRPKVIILILSQIKTKNLGKSNNYSSNNKKEIYVINILDLHSKANQN